MDWTTHSVMLLAELTVLGFGVGFLTGLFGVGGGFIATPIMISLLGVEPSVAVGSSLGFAVGASSLGLFRHLRAKNVEPKIAWLVGSGAVAGTIIGFLIHHRAAYLSGEQFQHIISVAFIVLLAVIAIVIGLTIDRVDRHPLLSKLRLPPYIAVPRLHISQLSAPGLVLIGLPVGFLSGMFGIGGGVVLLPALILVVGMKPHAAVGTSLATVLACALLGCALYAFGSKAVDVGIVAALLLGSSVGTLIGAYVCNRLHADHLHRLFAVVVGVTAVFLWIQLQFGQPR
jgi:uncharacterized membrane protein YfcA